MGEMISKMPFWTFSLKKPKESRSGRKKGMGEQKVIGRLSCIHHSKGFTQGTKLFSLNA